MKNFIINNSMNLITNNFPQYNQTKLEEIRYGLISIYLLITKLIVIFIIAFILKIQTEVIIFMITYNVIRTFSFGLHATKSWICLLTSIIIFIGIPFVAKSIIISNKVKYLVGIVLITLIFKNSPADTEKRPIINRNRRIFFKLVSTIITIIYIIICYTTKNNYLSNCLVMSLLIQNVCISPMTYRIFNLKCNNYKYYISDQD